VKRWKAWLASAVALALSLGMAAYAALGFAVTSSTGTMGAGQRTFFDLLFLGALLGAIAAVVLFLLGLRRAARH
jgi:hypothetical protein